MFDLLKARVLSNAEKDKEKNRFFIENGFLPTWNENEQNNPDRGIERYSTESKWKAYQAGTLSRKKAVEIACKRAARQIDKSAAVKLNAIAAAEKAVDLSFIAVSVEWNKSRMWGYNPAVEVITNTGRTTGSASGCGYDKESAAIADAFNKNPAIVKILFSLAENALQENSAAAWGKDIGYGSGYGSMPYFEGGVGSSCFWSILEKAGFHKTADNGGNRYHYYELNR